MTEKQEFWDIYNEKSAPGRTMKQNDWCLKDNEYHRPYQH